MYPTRIVLRPAHTSRVAKSAPSACRGMSSSFFPGASLSPFWGSSCSPLSSRAAALSPFSNSSTNGDIFRLFDESARAFDNTFSSLLSNNSTEQRVWQPRFDVQEHDDAYELRGELPGVDAQNLDVQFADPSTLVVRGRVESSRTEGTQPATAAADADTTMSGAADGVAAETASTTEAAAEAAADTSDAASVHSDSSYVQPTVEDDAPETASTLTGGSNHMATPSASTAAAAAAEDAAKQAAAPEQTPAEKQPSSHYWLSERRTGSFARTFRFPARIDHDSVSASLRNGVLSIRVPKAAEPAPRRIAVL